jgi:hypothetical protein
MSLYWALQILGWAAYAVFAGVAAMAGRPFSIVIVASYASFALLGITLTHQWRGVMLRQNWAGSPAAWLLPRFLAAVALIVLVLVFYVDASAHYLDDKGFQSASELLRFSSWVFVTFSLIITIWGGIWLFVQGIRQRRAMLLRQARMELAVRDAELRLLRSQVNPHFLFNALNSLRSLIAEDPTAARDMTSRLASILRYSLSAESRDLVPLSEEMVLVNDYLALEKMRMEERLVIDLQIAPAAESALLPPMAVQTLVENAIKHGIAPLPRGGRLLLQATREGDALVVCVQNPGQLRSETSGTRVGLENLRQRLRLLCGETASFQLQEHAGSVEATIRLPWRRKEAAA